MSACHELIFLTFRFPFCFGADTKKNAGMEKKQIGARLTAAGHLQDHKSPGKRIDN